MSSEELPASLVAAIREWADAVEAGPHRDTCENPNHPDCHADNCAWVRAGMREYYASKNVGREVRKWVRDRSTTSSGSGGV